MNQGFRCKQFFIAHDQCAMKVGTDSLLLGAWALLPEHQQAKPCLDIGSGSGLLALMLAQRLQVKSQTRFVCAVEIDASAAEQAAQNVALSPWANQIQVIQGDILTYAQQDHHVARFELVLSNPPYFEQSLKSTDEKRALARHTDSLPLPKLLEVSSRLASPTGSFALVLPVQTAREVVEQAPRFGWYLQRWCEVSENPRKKVKLALMQFGREVTAIERTTLFIRDEASNYSEAYRALLADFYLNF